MTLDEICNWLTGHQEELGRVFRADPTGLDEAVRKADQQLARLQGKNGFSRPDDVFRIFLDTLMALPQLEGLLPQREILVFLAHETDRAHPGDYRTHREKVAVVITSVRQEMVAARFHKPQGIARPKRKGLFSSIWGYVLRRGSNPPEGQLGTSPTESLPAHGGERPEPRA